MDSSKIAQKVSGRSVLSPVDQLGSFDFATGLIHLNSVSARDLEYASSLGMEMASRKGKPPKALPGKLFEALSKFRPLATHEYTHFIDSTSTIWGLKHLRRMSEAYASSVEFGGREHDFYRAKEFADHLKRIRLPSYYTQVFDRPEGDARWGFNISVGRVFNGKGEISSTPVLFSRFETSTGVALARSPMSAVSVLEASAMAQELLVRNKLLGATERDYRLVEQRAVSERTTNFVYNKAVTEYSVCVHVLSTYFGCADILQAFAMCAKLTRLVLRFPTKLMALVAEKCPVSEILQLRDDGDGKSFAKAIQDGLSAGDLGILFYMLCNAMPRSAGSNEKLFTKALGDALARIGTCVEQVDSESLVEAHTLASVLSQSPIASIRKLGKAGLENFTLTDWRVTELDFSALSIPAVLLQDDHLVQVFSTRTAPNSLAEFDVEAAWLELDTGHDWVVKFVEACV